MRTKRSLFNVVVWLAAASLSSQMAAAQGNGSCNGERVSGKYFENRTNIYYSGGDHLATETTTFTVTGNFQSFSIAVSGDQTGTLCNSATACNGFSFTAPADGIYRFEMTGRGGAAIGPNPISPTGPGVSGEVVSNCIAATTEPNDDGPGEPGELDLGSSSSAATAASFAAAASGTSSLNRMTSFGQTHGTPGITPTRNGLRFSTSGEGGFSGDGWTLWGDAGYQEFDGDIDGDNLFVTLGADTHVGVSTRLGFMIDYSDLDVTTSGTVVTTETLTFGPYVSVDLNGKWSLDAFLAYGEPDYEVGGTGFSAERVMGGVSLNADYMVKGVAITSFISADGFSEDQPAVGVTPSRTVSNIRASLGTIAEFNPGEAVRPYLSLAAEVSEFDDGLGTDTSNFSPRLGAGMTVDGDLGSFHVGVEGGEVIDGTQDYTFSLGFEARF